MKDGFKVIDADRHVVEPSDLLSSPDSIPFTQRFPDRTVGDLTNNDRISKDARWKILWDNPKRLYSLEV